jgi:zinc/manganese transport system substrate-binding protein
MATVVVTVLVAAGCGSGAGASDSTGRVRVVAAENFWGSIAAQLGGAHVDVDSVITNPATDPHDYEPTAADGRGVAEASLVIENGVGYDPWMSRLVAANQTDGQRVLNVGTLIGLPDGANPHRWYFPPDVEKVSSAITAQLKRVDPTHSAYYQSRHEVFETTGLATYHRLIAEIRSRYAGTAVGASESIFEGVARATGLDLVTPAAYLRAISEGDDPTAGDTATVHEQISTGRIKVWVFNSQNATPDIQALNRAARARHIPVTTITETMVPSRGSFEQWQVKELRSLESALHRATGR